MTVSCSYWCRERGVATYRGDFLIPEVKVEFVLCSHVIVPTWCGFEAPIVMAACAKLIESPLTQSKGFSFLGLGRQDPRRCCRTPAVGVILRPY